ncbi:MAG: hypothetical protein JO168_05015 [Solirubrobacterales bacterium]|nr:hypothetical protein [Solirubrobacterales bacterium]MBV9714924.1 hypothetical protein [Solirubrobacterales bacterium]
MRLLRAAVAVLALVVCAWFALGARQAHELSAAGNLITTPGALTRPQAAHAEAMLRAAATLNPDSQVDVLRGRLALTQGQRARATNLFTRVAEREPMNVVAWYWLAQDPQSYGAWLVALARVAQLEPRLPAPG